MTSRFYFDFALPRHSPMLTTTSLSSTTAGRDEPPPRTHLPGAGIDFRAVLGNCRFRFSSLSPGSPGQVFIFRDLAAAGLDCDRGGVVRSRRPRRGPALRVEPTKVPSFYSPARRS